jgi:RNA recognition motif-containing protein
MDIFTKRSGIFASARKPEWLSNDPKRPVDLKNEDPKVFEEYLNWAYFGANSVLDYIEDFEREALGNNIDTAMKTVFVGNLSPDASDNILDHHFQECGGTYAVSHTTWGPGRSGHFACVRFPAIESAKNAVHKHDGSTLKGRETCV